MRVRQSILRVAVVGLWTFSWCMAPPAPVDGGNGVPRYYVPRPPHHFGGQRWLRPGHHRCNRHCDAPTPGQSFIVDPTGYMPSDYGIYTGAPRDEARLLHLGADGIYAGPPEGRTISK